MKKTILIPFILITLVCSAQKAVKDSATIEQEKQQRFLVEVVSNLKIYDFQNWYYESATSPKMYDEFMKAYQLFLQVKYAEWSKSQKK